MIEVVKEGKLPKNIRQIGQVVGNQKVYLEDYVITYLKQVPTPEENLRVIILYGKKEMIEDDLCWFVNGAVGAEKDFFMEKTIIDQDSWQRVNEMAGRFFPELTVLGWAIVGNASTQELEEQIMRTQKQFFRSDQKLYFEYNTEEKEEYIYLYEKGKMRLQSGYYIYYERNECMQNYMVSLRVAERHPEEFEADRATHQFRTVVNEKKQEVHRRRSNMMMTCVSLVLMMVVMVLGIALLGNYEKMQSMEEVLYQISGKIDQGTQVDEAIKIENVQETLASGEASLTEEAVSSEAALEENKIVEAEVVSEESENVEESVAAEESEVAENSVAPEESEVAEKSVAPEESGDLEGEAATETPDQSDHVEQTTYIIQKGDTLAKICMKYYGSLSGMDEICRINGINDKDTILYGQKILLP